MVKAAKKRAKLLPILAAPLTAAFLMLTPAAASADTETSAKFYESARDWLEKGDFRAAVIQLRNALQQDPDNLSARVLLGRLYLQSGNPAAAEKELNYAHQRQPTDETEIYLGRAQLALRKYRDVLSTVRETADDPANAATKAVIRAEALFALNVLDESESIVAGLLQADSASIPGNLLMARIKARQGEMEAADSYIDAALLAQPELIEAHILRAQLAMQVRDIDKVLAVADKIIEIAPDDPRGQLMKAEALVRKNALEEARAVLSAFLEKSPDATAALYLHARVLMLLNEFEAADVELQKLPDPVRRQPAASLIIGLVKHQLGQYAQAEEALERFVAAAGDQGRQARRLLARIQLQSERPLAAIQTLKPLTQPTSSDVAAFQLGASAALRAGDLDRMQNDLERVSQVGSAGDRRQAAAFLQVLQTATRNEAGKLTLDPVALGVLEALDLAQFGEGEEALARAQALQQENPDNAAVANLLSRLYVARGDLDQARAVLEPVLASDPSHFGSITNMNRIDISEGNFDAVRARLENALEMAPESEPLILQLAGFLANRGDEAAALELLREKAAALPDSLAIRNNLINIGIRQGRTEDARRWADEARRIGETSNPNGLSVAAQAYTRLKDYEAAAAAYEALAAQQGDSSGVLLQLAQVQLLADDQEASQATVERVLASEPGNFAANRALINMLLGAKDEEGAMAAANKAAEASPVLGAVLRAEVYRRTGRIEEAVKELQNQLALTPSAALVQQTYGMMVEAGRRAEAADVVSAWLGENPDDATMLQLLSSHYIQDGQFSEARGLLERAYSMLPNNVIVLNNLAWLRYELQEAGAVEMARRAYQMAPNAPAIADTLGWILVREGEFEEGLELLFAAADAAPENGDIGYHVAFALNKTGKPQEARATLERVLSADIPDQNFTEREKAEALLRELSGS